MSNTEATAQAAPSWRRPASLTIAFVVLSAVAMFGWISALGWCAMRLLYWLLS